MSVKIDGDVGIMPQKTYVFWILIFIIFFIAIVNFLLLIIIMSFLRLGGGMESMEIVSNEDMVKFFGNVDFDQVLYEKNMIKGFNNVPIQVTSNGGSIIMSTIHKDEPDIKNKISLSSNGVTFSDVNKFDVIDPHSGRNIFSTDYKDFTIPKSVPHLDVKKLRVNRLVSTHETNLTIKSDIATYLGGSEGVRIRGKEVTFTADGDVYLNSVSGNIHLLANNVNMKNVPVFEPRPYTRSIPQFKLCVCMPEGILFKIPIHKNLNIKPSEACNYVDLSPGKNPCTK